MRSDGELRWEGLLVGYGEVALKSRPVRRRFVRKLMHNIRQGMKEHGIDAKVNHRWARIFVETEKVEEAIDVLRRIFGIVYFSPYKLVKLAELKEFVSENADRLLMGARTFAVRVRRTGKHDFTSMDLEREMGAILKERTGLKVSLKDPERTVFIEVRDEICFIYTDKIRGPGGLPLGTAGKVVCLISGGIDSPVAAWLMMRRGCSIISLFAHFPLGGDESDLRRFKKVVKLLKRWHIGEEMPVYLYRHEHNLVAFRKTAQNYTCVLCRRMMYRVAGELAKKLGARAIVTGENLAQVASQTLQNLYVIDKAVDLPVLRPLIGFEKDESITLAKHIGTYEASCTRVSTGCIPVKGCWARPKKPVTKAKEEVVAEHESKMSVEELLERSVRSLKEVQIA